MFTFLWKCIVSVFTADKIGILIRILLTRTGIKLISDILNPENQRKAYDFVKELKRRDDLTSLQKAGEFNKKMLEWSLKEGKNLGKSAINCLREMAVNAIKAELPNAVKKMEDMQKKLLENKQNQPAVQES